MPIGHVDQEDGPPSCASDVGGDEQAAEELAGHGGEPAGGAVPAQGAGAALAGGGGLDGGEHLGHHQRGGGALRRAGDDQHLGGGRQAAQQRGQGEGGHPGEEQPPAAEAVAQASAQHEQQGVGGGVRGDDELQHGRAGVQVAVDGGQGHVDDEEVHHRQQHPDQHDHEADRAHRLALRPGGSPSGGRGRGGPASGARHSRISDVRGLRHVISLPPQTSQVLEPAYTGTGATWQQYAESGRLAP